jgi:hypothetical protein
MSFDFPKKFWKILVQGIVPTSNPLIISNIRGDTVGVGREGVLGCVWVGLLHDFPIFLPLALFRERGGGKLRWVI